MDRWQGKVAVVTGASSGIGAAIAKDLVESGMKVVGLARRLERMEQDAAKMNTSKGGHYYPRKCDVSKEEEILEAFAWVKKTFGGVDVLVNNAGIVRANMLVNPGNSNDLRSVIDVNVMALCYCTREAFNSMKERDVAGHIIHINSIGGHSIPSAGDAPPTANMYFGSKHCVTALTETLRQEMIYLKSRTKVTSISPGVVDTEIFDGSFPSKEIKEMFLANNPSLKSEDVSQAVLYALGTPEHVQVHELIIKPIGEKFMFINCCCPISNCIHPLKTSQVSSDIIEERNWTSKMDRWIGKVAVVTGASAGIGAAVSKDLVEAGMKVVGLARRLERMEENAAKMDTSKGGKFYPKKCDLAKESEIMDVFSWIKENLGGVDVMINNAGMMKMTMLTTPDNGNDLRTVLDINVMALCICTREAFNSMKERDVAGHIIHINSLTGHHVPYLGDFPPVFNIYPGSKHCVTALTETLRQEMNYLKSKTKITSISPGHVATEFLEEPFGQEQSDQIKQHHPTLQPEDISQSILFVLGTPEHVQVHELIIKPVGEKS
ncbi:uncharacterized protein LOC113370303 [Ctenocephalides felis]|uniref:uncharacterized protein LOC113370303 n=1 Tax=Ctenocephalides felis TaxID=7515 RepID=UPI000E6E1CE2|nr:uncharacterized protein LOC113370303 [Ctenocephalides felis]